MNILKAYVFKLKVDQEIDYALRTYAGHCRFIWNYFWHINHNRLQRGERIISNYYEMDFWTKLLKQTQEYSFLNQVPAHLLQQKLLDLAEAYRSGFDKSQAFKRLPKARRKSLHNTFRFPEPKHIQIDNRRIKLPKIGWISFYKSYDIQGQIKNVTLSCKAGSWYMSIQVLQSDVCVIPKTGPAIGLDVGITKFVVGSTLQDDTQWLPINSFRTLETQIAKQQRKLKHKCKFSNNWRLQVQRIQKLHNKVANVRRHHLHQVSTEICKNHAMIFVEDLKIRHMSASASGTLDRPGRCIKAKSGLNKSILDQGWYNFKQMLIYKSAWNAGQLIQVDPRFTSQICSRCLHKDQMSRRSQADFVCTQCHFEINADINAARNILAAGLSRDGLCCESLQWSSAETCGNTRVSTTLS